LIHRFFTRRAKSFSHAFAGIHAVLTTQENAWIHLTATILVVILAALLQLGVRDWVVLVLVIGLVWICEFINTSIEAAIDLSSPEIHPTAKIGKDVAAGAVLLAALTAMICGLLILGPPLWQKLVALTRLP
jgi:diacylglycerol kinase (ATP)